MPGLRLEHLENIHDRITEGLNQGFGKITDRLDALDPASLFSRDQTFIRFNSFEHRVTVLFSEPKRPEISLNDCFHDN